MKPIFLAVALVAAITLTAARPASAVTASVTVSLSPTTIPADGNAALPQTPSTSSATAVLKDATGAPVSGTTVTWATTGDTTFSNGGSCSTGSDGSCSVTITSSTTADDETISAVSGDGRSGTAVLHEYAVPTNVTVTPPSQHIPADGKTLTSLQVTVAAGTGVSQGAPVSFSHVGDGDPSTSPGSKDLTFPNGATCTTDNNGVCSMTVQASTTAGAETIKANADGITGTASITEDPLPVVQQITLALSPAAIAANGASTSRATAVATSGGGPSAFQTVTFSADKPAAITFNPQASCITDTTGSCFVTIKSGTTSNDVQITASWSGGAATQTLHVFGPTANVSLSPATQNVVGDGTSTVKVNATLTDATGVFVGGAVVAFGTSGDMTFPSGNTCVTSATANNTGSCTVVIQSSTTPGSETVTAVSGGHSGTAAIVEIGPPSRLGFRLSPDHVLSDGAQTAVAAVKVVDINGLTLSGVPVSFSTSGDVTFSNGGGCTTDSNGVCSLTITASRSPGPETITAAAGPASESKTLTENPGVAGYWLLDQAANVTPFNLSDYGSGGITSTTRAVAIAAHDAHGYLLAGADGSVAAHGNAVNFGNATNLHLTQPIVGMALRPQNDGYWLLGADGGIFTYGPGARFFGSTGGKPLNKPVVGIAVTPSGNGYWLVASDGGIFAFGDAAFYGSMGGKPLNKPVVGMTAPLTGGYLLVASDGGMFVFGGAHFFGSMGGRDLQQPIVAMASKDDGNGYWEVASDGGLFSFNAPYLGSLAGRAPAPVTGMAAYGSL